MEIHPLILAGSALAITVTVIHGAFWLGAFKGEWKERAKKLEQNEEDCRTLKDNIAEIKANINILLNKSGLGTTSQNSPVELTAKGEEIRKKLDVDRIVTERYKQIKEEFEDISNVYDIQVKATDLGKHLFESLNEDEKDVIKKVAYEEGLPLVQIYPIFSVILRNTVFEEKGLEKKDARKVSEDQPKS